MNYIDFKGKKLSTLGYGCMRLPTLEGDVIDEVRTAELFDRAIKAGVNYFDTAYMYHSYKSEVWLVRFLRTTLVTAIISHQNSPGTCHREETTLRL